MIAPPSSSVQSAHSDGGPDDSDSDWDDDDDFVTKKINIKIKPIAQLTPGKISASTDELRATVGTWKSMANINLVKPNSRRSLHQSTMLLNKLPFEAGNDPSPQPLMQPPLPPSPPRRISNENPLGNQFIAATADTTFAIPPVANVMVPPPRLQQQQQQQSAMGGLLSSKPVGKIPFAPLVPAQVQPHPLIQAKAGQPSLPVALATQECLNVRTLPNSEGEISTSLIGHIKMAVPRNIIEMNASYFENNDLVLRIVTSKRWSTLKTNSEYVRHLKEEASSSESYFFKLVSLDMAAVYSFARQSFQRQPDSRYFLLPELLNYTIRSHSQEESESYDQHHVNNNDGAHMPPVYQNVSPIRAVAHWLCDLSVTKVRVDIEFLEDSLELAERVQPDDLRNVKLSMQVNGNVVSQQSKPQAVWSPIDSRLTWSFASLQELIESSTLNGVTSCLAKLTLSDGPSTPSASSLSFSIAGKTLSGVTMVPIGGEGQSLSDDALTYKLIRQKREVRTGIFRYEPPCL